MRSIVKQVSPSPHNPPPLQPTSSPIWIAMGAAIVGVVIGAAAVHLGRADRPRPVLADTVGPVASAPVPTVASSHASKPVPSLTDAVARTRDTVVILQTPRGLGAGVIVDPQGIVLTNYHVIADALVAPRSLFGGEEPTTSRLVARFANDRRMEAKIIVADPQEDLAVLQLMPTPRDGQPPETFKAAKLGISADLKVGQEVFAVGNPVGLPHSVARGIVSALDRTGVLQNALASLIQLDASINLGNSGGPLFNLDGELVGIVTARPAPAEAQGIAFALPFDHISAFLRSAVDRGSARAGMIGIVLAPGLALPPTVVELGYREGLTIDTVQEGRPGATAGLRRGDTIVALRGKRFDGLEPAKSKEGLIRHLQGTVRAMFPGETLPVTVVRGEQVVQVSVEVTAASDAEQSYIDVEDMLGLVLSRSEHVPTIEAVTEASILRRYAPALGGVVIVRLMGAPVTSVEDFAQRLVELRTNGIRRGGRPRVILRFRDAKGAQGDSPLLELR